MPNDYVPEDDSDYDEWQRNLRTEAAANPADYGFTPAEITAIEAEGDAWDEAYALHLLKKTEAAAAASASASSRATQESSLRHLYQSYSTRASATNAGRLRLGGNALGEGEPLPTFFTSYPVIVLLNGDRLRHTLRFRDSVKSKGKPTGAIGLGLYRYIGAVGTDAPADLSGYTRLGLFSKLSTTVDFIAADGNKTAHYLGRWEGLNNMVSTLSTAVAGTILP